MIWYVQSKIDHPLTVKSTPDIAKEIPDSAIIPEIFLFFIFYSYEWRILTAVNVKTIILCLTAVARFIYTLHKIYLIFLVLSHYLVSLPLSGVDFIVRRRSIFDWAYRIKNVIRRQTLSLLYHFFPLLTFIFEWIFKIGPFYHVTCVKTKYMMHKLWTKLYKIVYYAIA